MWQTGPESNEPEWRVVEDVPFDMTLYAVVNTVEGPYAIGESGAVLGNNGDGWEVIIEDGPNVRSNRLMGLDVTSDKKRIWFAGSSGAMGYYDVEQQRKFDYSYPKEKTSTWEAICVTGDAGSEKGLAANGSGEILPFTMDGQDIDWGVTSKPAHKGASVKGLAATPDGRGYAIDTNGNAFRTTPEDGWEDIGIVNAQVKFYDIYAAKDDRVWVAGGGGRLYRYDDSYHDWTPINVGDASLRAIAVNKIEEGYKMVCLGSGGNIYVRDPRNEDDRWEKQHTPTTNTLNDIVLGETDIAVGRSGTIMRRPKKPRQSGKSADGDNYEGRGENWDGDDNARGESTSDGSSSDGSTSDGSSSDGSSSG